MHLLPFVCASVLHFSTPDVLAPNTESTRELLLQTGPSWSMVGGDGSELLGWSVAPAGDVNGDGYGDILAGAPGDERGQTDEGRIFLYLGGPAGPAVVPSWWAESNQAAAQLGWSVAGVGDLNGDGYDDIAAGANLYDGGQTNEGKVFVWFGGPSGLGANGRPSNADWSFEPDQIGAQAGTALAGGDVNGDGFSDLVVGAWLYNNGQGDEGGAFLFPGGPKGPATAPSWSAEGDQAVAGFGYALASGFDVNGDGFADVIVGAPWLDGALTDAGAIWFYPGGPAGLSPLPTWSASGSQAGEQLGYSVAMAGDVNGDGYGDVIGGARAYDGLSSNEGRAFVFAGSSDGPGSMPLWSGLSGTGFALYGYSVSGAGDVNGDGFDEILVGADGYSGAFGNEGKVYLYAGSAAGPSLEPAWSFRGGQTGAFLGRSVAGGHDINGDGYADILAGADGFDASALNEGQLLLFTGPF